MISWSKQDLEKVIKSKEDFALVLGVQGRYFLPDKDCLTYEFMRDVLDGKKKLLEVSELRTLTMPPKVEGLIIASMWEQVKQDPRLFQYFPAFHGRIPPNAYFFSILNSVYPGFTEDLCRNIRLQKELRESEEAKIQVSEEIQQFLAACENPGLFKDAKVGDFLKKNRKWATTRTPKPLDLAFNLPSMATFQSASKKYWPGDSYTMDTPKK